MSIRATLFLAIFLATLAAWGSATYFSYHDTQKELDKLFDAHLAESARAILAQAQHEKSERRYRGHDKDEDHEHDETHEKNERGIADIKRHGEILEKRLAFQIWDQNNQLLMSSSNSIPSSILADATTDGYSYRTTRSGELRIFTAWSDNRNYRVTVAESVDARRAIAGWSVRRVIAPISWTIVPLLLLLGITIEVALRPLRRLSIEIGRRSPDELSPIPEHSLPSEILPTITALNRLFDRVAAAIENERRFTADASHELRTPLAAVKIQAQVAQREMDAGLRKKALDALVKGVDRATHLVDQLLTMARLDPDQGFDSTTIQLKKIVSDVVQKLAPEALAKGIEISLEALRDVTFQGSPSMVELLVRNLVDNAVRYTPQGGTVQVHVGQLSDSVQLQIQDSGPGLTADQQERIGQRFSRLTRPSGEGSGLGLSIVYRIAKIHHARVLVENRKLGPGLIVTVEFPMSRGVT